MQSNAGTRRVRSGRHNTATIAIGVAVTGISRVQESSSCRISCPRPMLDGCGARDSIRCRGWEWTGRLSISLLNHIKRATRPSRTVSGPDRSRPESHRPTLPPRAGRRWAMVILPVRDRFCGRGPAADHEAAHVAQPSVLPRAAYSQTGAGFGLLDEPAGRTWLRLEWRALVSALRSSGEAPRLLFAMRSPSERSATQPPSAWRSVRDDWGKGTERCLTYPVHGAVTRAA